MVAAPEDPIERQTRAILSLRAEMMRRLDEFAERAEAERQAHREAAAAGRAQAELVRGAIAPLVEVLRGRWVPIVLAVFLGLSVGLGLAGAREIAQLAIGAALEQAVPR